MTNLAGDAAALVPQASMQDGSYPRPQLVRPHWSDLCGVWSFRFDDADRGLSEHWHTRSAFEDKITVPFPPESESSGIHDTGFHPVVWYQRELTAVELTTAGYRPGLRLILHFGAVDYRCRVWFNGQFLGGHEGGHTPFSFDVTDSLNQSGARNVLVVRAEDDPQDVSQPRGKQDWQLQPHSVWYHRTTGIWQPVWLEAVPTAAIERLLWLPDPAGGSVGLKVTLSGQPVPGTTLSVALSCGGHNLGSFTLGGSRKQFEVTIPLPSQSNGQARSLLLWSPEHPRLIDAAVCLSTPDGLRDSVQSYFGLRSVGTARGHFLLNERPYYLRSVLNQGYWPRSHLASPSADALRAEAQLIKDLGFNAVRIHQKIEDPRFLFWTDRLGLLVWEEAPSAYEFSMATVRRMTAEWIEALERDLSHPSIVTWVPLNESWGVEQIARDAAMQEYSHALHNLTKCLDPNRPVVSNDGWEHLDSDIWTIHDYEESAEVVEKRYHDDDARKRLFAGIGPAGRLLRLSDEPDRGQPIMLTEFGGIQFTPVTATEDASQVDDVPRWGYSTASSAEDYFERLRGLVSAVESSNFLAGYCYTQLTDTLQEANGLVTDNRMPKIPIERLRKVFANKPGGISPL